jgi:hypothetical protein
MPKLKDGVLSLMVETNFEGNNLDDLVGDIKLSNGLLFTPGASVDLDSLTIKAERVGDRKSLRLRSNFAEGNLTGKYYFGDIKNTIQHYIGHFFPSVKSGDEKQPLQGQNNFEFELRFMDLGKIMGVIIPEMVVSDKGYVKGKFNSEKATLDLDGELDYLSYRNFSAEKPQFHVHNTKSDQVSITVRTDMIRRGKSLALPNFSIHQKAGSDTLQTNVFWNNWDVVTNSGALFSTTSLKPMPKVP